QQVPRPSVHRYRSKRITRASTVVITISRLKYDTWKISSHEIPARSATHAPPHFAQRVTGVGSGTGGGWGAASAACSGTGGGWGAASAACSGTGGGWGAASAA